MLTHAKSILVSPPDLAIDRLVGPHRDEKVKAVNRWMEHRPSRRPIPESSHRVVGGHHSISPYLGYIRTSSRPPEPNTCDPRGSRLGSAVVYQFDPLDSIHRGLVCKPRALQPSGPTGSGGPAPSSHQVQDASPQSRTRPRSVPPNSGAPRSPSFRNADRATGTQRGATRAPGDFSPSADPNASSEHFDARRPDT